MPQYPLNIIVEKLKTNDPSFTALKLSEIMVPDTEQDIKMSFETPNFSDDVLKKLANAIKLNNTIRTFAVDLSYLDDGNFYIVMLNAKEGLKALTDALKNHSTLQHLDLSSYVSKTIPELLGILTGTADIQTFSLIVDHTDDALLKRIGDCLAKNDSITKITIKECNDVHTDGLPDSTESIFQTDSLQAFARGFSNKPLQVISITNLMLGYFGVNEILKGLSKTANLTSLTFNRCNIHKYIMGNILQNHLSLTNLDFSRNPISVGALETLIDQLPFLNQLKILNLRRSNINSETFSYLAAIWSDHRLKIQKFHAGNAKNPWINSDGLIKIIEKNEYLKQLIIDDHQIKIEHIKDLKDVLSLSKRCQLQEFRFGIKDSWSNEFETLLIDIVKSNKHIMNLRPISTQTLSKDLEKACKDNVRNAQQSFIRKAIELSNVYCGIPEDNNQVHISRLGVDIFLKILLHLGKDTFGMSDEDILVCSKLIFDNFSLRRKLIEAKQYVPINKENSKKWGSYICQWWSPCTRDDNAITIFQQCKKNKITADNHTPTTKKFSIM